jgi:hypothetical protein
VDTERERIADEVAARLGAPGIRARDFLGSADAILAVHAGGVPKRAELAAYAIREALTSITAGIGFSSRFREISRVVVAAADGAQGQPDDPVASARLFQAIEGLREFTRGPTIHEARMIELIMRRTGHEPLRLAPDPVAEYRHLVEMATTSLHSTAEDPEELLSRVFALLGRLFAPAEMALAELDRFIEMSNPTPQDAVELAERLVSAAHLRYFSDRAQAPGWLEALSGSPLGQPDERWAGWPVGDLAISVASEEPELAAGWLARAFADCPGLNPGAAFHFARVAAGIGPSAWTVLIETARRLPTDPSVAAFADQVLSAADPDDEVVELLADVYLNGRADEWFSGQILAAFVNGTTEANWERRLQLLGFKLHHQEKASPMSLDVALSGSGPISDLTVSDELLGSAQYLIAGTAGVVRRALETADPGAVIAKSDALPPVVEERVKSWLFGVARLGNTEDAIRTIAQAIETIGPTEDHFAVIDRAWSEDPERSSEAWTQAMGAPPAEEEIEVWKADDTRKLQMWQNRAWCAALPEVVVEPWMAAAVAIADRPVPSRAALLSAQVVTSGWGHSPISVDHLRTLSPSDAAELIAAWRPTTDDWLASPVELGQALTEVVKGDPEGWAAALPHIVGQLRHATYIAHLLTGLRSKARELTDHAEQLLDAVALVAAKPWEIELLDASGGSDFDNSWENAWAEAVALVEALAIVGVDVAADRPEAFDLVLTAVGERPEYTTSRPRETPGEAAVNRPPMKALRAAITVGWRTARSGNAAPAALLDTLDDLLALNNDDGLQARAIIATLLDPLREMDSEWMSRRHDLIFGPEAPENFGQRTVEMALNRPSVARWMLEELRAQIFEAAASKIDNGVDHVLMGMLNSTEGYSVEEVADWCRRQPDDLISEALGTLGHLLRMINDADQVDVGLALVAQLDAMDVAPEALAGLGRWWGIAALAPDRWTSLMLHAASRGTVLHHPSQVARHAVANLTDQTFALLQALLKSAPERWEQYGVTTEAIKALKAHSSQSQEREALRVALLDRGYFEVQDL